MKRDRSPEADRTVKNPTETPNLRRRIGIEYASHIGVDPFDKQGIYLLDFSKVYSYDEHDSGLTV
jgi:hypothetical protein